MIPYPVSEEKNKSLKERMEVLGVHEKDIEEKFIRSSEEEGRKSIRLIHVCISNISRQESK